MRSGRRDVLVAFILAGVVATAMVVSAFAKTTPSESDSAALHQVASDDDDRDHVCKTPTATRGLGPRVLADFIR